MTQRIQSIDIQFESDVVTVRQHARAISGALGFDTMEQARIATAVSEIARNALAYAGAGKVEFRVEQHDPAVNRPSLVIKVSDNGPGIADLPAVLAGKSTSRSGAPGRGIPSARRLMDNLSITSAPGRGTTVSLSKHFPPSRPTATPADLATATQVAAQQPADPFQEVRAQNQDLARALEELNKRQEELVRLNRELEDTNRGVVALYAELDEKALHLRHADELKSRFLSNMSHEFRTPLNSILALSRLLLNRIDGDLTEEQVRQVSYIHKSARDLSDLVNDLLDLAKVEAGKVTVNPTEIDVGDFLRALRGMFRPLLTNPAIDLVFEEPRDVPRMSADEGKLSQILRNLIANAIKFTESGEIRISARFDPQRETVAFAVSDTGIGIPAEDQARIFEEFTQIETPIQKSVKGTGLGLPLAKRLAELLGGSLSVHSEGGKGSTFTATLPVTYAARAAISAAPGVELDPTRHPLLVVEDNPETLMLYEKYLKTTGFQVLPAASAEEARSILSRIRPVAVVLDIVLQGGTSWDLLVELKRDDATRDIPVWVVSVYAEAEKAKALGADDFALQPLDRRWLIERLRKAVGTRPRESFLVIDDDDVSRYLLKGLLTDTRFAVLEATTGVEGLALARTERPRAILLDLAMADLSGFEVLDRLKADAATQDIPVIVVTSRILSRQEQDSLLHRTLAIISKESPSRLEVMTAIRKALVQTEPRQNSNPKQTHHA